MSQMVQTSSGGLIKGHIKLRPLSIVPKSYCMLLAPKEAYNSSRLLNISSTCKFHNKVDFINLIRKMAGE